MPTVLETAKDATYAAVGLNVLFLDEVNERMAEQRSQVEERFAGQRSQLEEQLEIAREHGQKARERVQPLARRTWEAYESAVMRISELAPAPVDGFVVEGLERVRGFMPEEVIAPAKPAEKQAAAKKAPAKKAAAKKAPAKKAAAKK